MSALPSPDELRTPSERLVIGPQKPIVVAASLGLGTMTAVCATACVLNRSVSAALICGLIGASFGYLILGRRIWVDSYQVGCTGVFSRGSCPRDQLACLSIADYSRRGGQPCMFVRRDGGVAFNVPARVFGYRKLAALAAYLGVPLLGKV